MAKQHHVPETKDAQPKLNREQRRHPERTDHVEDQNLSRDTGTKPELQDQEVPASTKPTADKWNQ